MLAEKMSMVKRALKKRNVTVKYRDIKTSIVEAIISRGDDELFPLLEHLARKGTKLEAWREFFRPELYDEWFRDEGKEMSRYLGKRSPDEKLPWSFIDTGVEEGFLLAESQKAESGEATVDCYEGSQRAALTAVNRVRQRIRRRGAGIIPAFKEDAPDPSIPLSSGEPVSYRFVFRYGKYGDSRYIGHLDTMGILLRGFRSAGIHIKMYRKFHPMPKISMSEALPMGVESMCELIEVESDGGPFPNDAIIGEMNESCREALKYLSGVTAGCRAWPGSVYIFLFRMSPPIWKRSGGRRGEGNASHILKERKGLKDLWKSGAFTRIVKMEARRINGIGTNN